MKNRTPEEIHREGMAALRERLGLADTLQFLLKIKSQSGDYAVERREWVNATSMEDIERMLDELHNRGGAESDC